MRSIMVKNLSKHRPQQGRAAISIYVKTPHQRRLAGLGGVGVQLALVKTGAKAVHISS